MCAYQARDKRKTTRSNHKSRTAALTLPAPVGQLLRSIGTCKQARTFGSGVLLHNFAQTWRAVRTEAREALTGNFTLAGRGVIVLRIPRVLALPLSALITVLLRL